MAEKKPKKKQVKKKSKLPIEHWSHSSLMAYLRNPLAWYKRYVEKIYDTPTTPSAVVGRAGHYALQHFYSGADKETATKLGLEYMRKVPDFEINLGKAKPARAKRARRAAMEKEYEQVIGYYLARAPKHKVVAVEISGVVEVEGHALPLKAISDLVVEAGDGRSVDIVDHKFVAGFSKSKEKKPLFVIQALFNYYTVRELFGRPVRRFIVYECKKTKNADGKSQLRKYVLDFNEVKEEFAVFQRLINEATAELLSRKIFLPNPSDMFEGENSFDVYRLGL